MSSPLETELDLEKLFLPSWAQEQPAGNRFEKYTGTEGDVPERRRSGGSRGDSFGGRGDSRPRPGGGGGGGGPRPGGGPGGGGRFGDRKSSGPRRDDRGSDRGQRRERPEPPAPLPEVAVTFLPVEIGVESLARQIRMTGRAYPLFQIAQLVLDKPERYLVQLTIRKNPDGTPKQPLFSCALDDTPWLSEEEAVAHVIKNHFATFYTPERTATEPPKGVYTFVAQCGFSGVILGPPNHHDYQNQLHKLHTERFSRMPFEAFKARVRIVRDEVVVKKWVEDQSFKTEYVCLNVPEPLKLPSLEEVEKHFRAVHKDAIIKPVETYTVAGVLSRNLRSRELQRLVRTEWEQNRYFPLPVATSLSRSFSSHGLHFFKVNKTVTHVAVARPTFLDLEASPVSESIKRIVTYVNEHPKCSRRKMVEALAPAPAAPTVIEVKPGEPKAAESAEPTPEQTALIADLHWLVHQGHVLEFADGKLETAKRPAPKPPKPEPKPATPVTAPAVPVEGGTPAAITATVTEPAAASEVPVTTTGIPVSDIVPDPALEAPLAAPVAEPEIAAAVPASVAEAAPVAVATAAPVAEPVAVPVAEPVVVAPVVVPVAETPNQNVSVPPVS